MYKKIIMFVDNAMETINHETSTPVKNNATSHPRNMTGGGGGK